MADMTRAQIVAWNIYTARVESVVNDQHEAYREGFKVIAITIAPPTNRHAEIVQGALDLTAEEATQKILSAALAPILQALDAIDNSHTKSDTVKACRVSIQEAYDALHALKREGGR